MQGDYWNDFYRTGKVSDYLKYANSVRETTENKSNDCYLNQSSSQREWSKHAGKSDGNGAFGNTNW